MNEHLPALESAISDVGYWQWWAADLPDVFQVEFGGAQLWSPPTAEGRPPSGQIALRFRNPRRVLFLTLSPDVPQDWPDRLHRDELEPFGVDHDAFTLTSADACGPLLGKAVAVRALVGDPDAVPAAGEAFLAFEAGPVGLIVAAESMVAVSHQGVLDEQAILEANRQWWAYWQEYWRRRQTDDPMPKDWACEVTIPLARG